MSALIQTYNKNALRPDDASTEKATLISGKSLSEIFWFSTSLVLFILLGPFSAIAALFGVLSMIPGDDKAMEPEPLHN